MIGLISLQGHIDQQALILLGKLCNAKLNFIFKQMFLAKLGQYRYKPLLILKRNWDTKSLIFNMLQLVSNVSDVIDNYICNSCFMTKHIWAQTVKEKIHSRETMLIESQLKSRLSLSLYYMIRSNEHRLWKLA